MNTSRCGSIGRKALGLLVALCALGGCGVVESRVAIDPSALPQLAESYAADPEETHFTRAITSEKIELEGDILRWEVRVRSEEDPRRVSVERFYEPFKAKLTADLKLAVEDTLRREEFSLPRVQDVVVTYVPASSMKKQKVGVGLMLGSALPLGLGAWILANAARSDANCDQECLDARGDGLDGIGWGLGTMMTVIGAGLAIPGIVLLSVGALRDPTDPRHRPSTLLRVQSTPGGVVLQGTF